MVTTRQALAAHAAKMAAKYGEEKVSNAPPAIIVSTGILSLDWALYVGGWQAGRIYEVLGPKDSGKTLLSIYAMREHRRRFPDRGVGYINLEKTFEERWAAMHGLECSAAHRKAGIWQPYQADTSEEASNMARDAIASGTISCLVIDSVGGMESAKVLGIDAEKDTMGKNAQVITKMVKALAGLGHANQCTIILVNQPRANMSGFGGDIAAGPKAMSHSTTAQIKMSSLGGEKDVRKLALPGDKKEEPTLVGNRVIARIPRLKNAPPGRRAEWFIMKQFSPEFGRAGVDVADDALSLGVRLGVIGQGNAGTYTLPGGTETIRGRAKVLELLRAEPAAMKVIRDAIEFSAPADPLEETA